MLTLDLGNNNSLDAIVSTPDTPFSATAPHEGVSPRYTFVSTRDILQALATDGGMSVTKIEYPKFRNPARRATGRHLITMSFNGVNADVGDDTRIMMLLVNSHDRTKALDVRLGGYRFVCSNGLVVGNDFFSYKHRHTASVMTPNDLVNYAQDLKSKIPQLSDIIRAMKSKQISKPQILEFATEAVQLRYPDTSNGLVIAPESLLRVNRNGDNTDTLWNTFNVVQENIVRGNVKNRKGRVVSALRNIDNRTKVNADLWTLAERYLS